MTPRPRVVRVAAHAKLNLGLAVGPRREDGYHEIATVYQSISLADTLTLRRRGGADRLFVRVENVALRGRATREAIPTGADNLVLQAARLFRERFEVRGGVELRLIKRIPAGSGLGGASADAAATLKGLARIHGVRASTRHLQSLAARLGSDVPFAVRGGTALGLGRGERLRRLRLARPFRGVVAVPSWRVSTALAYRRIDHGKYGLTLWDAKLRSAQALGRDGVTTLEARRLGNTFENALGPRRSSFVSLCSRLRAAGFDGPRLTGSGSAVFASSKDVGELKAAIKRFEGGERLYAVRSASVGTRFVAAP